MKGLPAEALAKEGGDDIMLFQSISSEKDAQALDLLIIAFLMLFTVAMFMQFGVPSITNGLGGHQASVSHSSIFGE